MCRLSSFKPFILIVSSYFFSQNNFYGANALCVSRYDEKSNKKVCIKDRKNGKDAEERLLERWGRLADDSILRTAHGGVAVRQLK